MKNIFDLLQFASANSALFFSEEGHYLFVHRDDKTGETSSKFIRTPDVVQAFAEISLDTGYLPQDIVRAGTKRGVPWYAQFVPAGKHALNIQHGDEFQVLQVRLPALVFVAFGQAYRIAATKAKAFDPGAEAFFAPLPNLSRSGAICWGANDKFEAVPKNAAAIWALFLHSPFSRDHIQGRSKKYPEDVRDMLRARAGLARPYPAGDLVSMGRSLDRFIEGSIGGRP